MPVQPMSSPPMPARPIPTPAESVSPLVAARPRASAPSPTATSSAAGNLQAAPLSVWVRLGLPIVLGILAASFNAAAVRSQIQPTRVYALQTDLPAGTRLTADHLSEVTLAGNLNRDGFLTPDDLVVKASEMGALSLEESLQRRPRILSKFMGRGELLSQASLGGLELMNLAENEEMVGIPIAQITGSVADLQPGQLLHFRIASRFGEATTGQDVGPFRIGYREQKNEPQPGARPGLLPVVYLVGADGKPTATSERLLQAIEREARLILVFKAAR